MNAKESFVEKLQRQFRERLQKLREENQERQREHQNFTNILPLQSRSLERGFPFSSLVYSFSFSNKSSPLSKFEKAFEAIRKNDKNCQETLRRYNFRKESPKKRKVQTSKLV
jgi:hypothetical protein